MCNMGGGGLVMPSLAHTLRQFGYCVLMSPGEPVESLASTKMASEPLIHHLYQFNLVF